MSTDFGARHHITTPIDPFFLGWKSHSQMNKTRHLVNILKKHQNMYFVVSEEAKRISFTSHAARGWTNTHDFVLNFYGGIV